MVEAENPRVLFVEDDGAIKGAMSEVLRDSGFEVIEAWDVAEALERLTGTDAIDIVFTDVRLPGKMDGIDLALHVRQHHPEMPVLIVSGYADALTKRLELVDPPKKFIRKPYSLENVADILRTMLGRPI